MDRTRTVEARTSDFLSVDRTRGKGGQGESGIPACRGGGDKVSKPRPIPSGRCRVPELW